MKIKLLLSCFVIVFAMTSTYASFPVKRAKLTPVTLNDNVTAIANANVANIAEVSSTSAVAITAIQSKSKDKWVGTALWFFLGWPFAAHRWYYGKPVGWNILFILTIGGLGIWAIVDLVNILTDNF